MRARWIIVVMLMALVMTITSAATAQDSDVSAHSRPVVHRVVPIYPDLARRLSISGTVKLIATVAPAGSVKSIEPIGGNPVLLKAAQDAVMNWKYAPAPAETKEFVELHFSR